MKSETIEAQKEFIQNFKNVTNCYQKILSDRQANLCNPYLNQKILSDRQANHLNPYNKLFSHFVSGVFVEIPFCLEILQEIPWATILGKLPPFRLFLV